MSLSRRVAFAFVAKSAIVLAGILTLTASRLTAEMPEASEGSGQKGPNSNMPVSVCEPSALDSPFIPVDSWVYPAVLRLYGLGYVDSVFLGMRPWTRASLDHLLEETEARIEDADPGPVTDEAHAIYEALDRELHPDTQGPCGAFQGKARLESVYTTARAISGTPLRDSFHLGQSIVNDYGRPYSKGFNNYTGASGYAAAGRFQVYARAEFQGSPSWAGYSTDLAHVLSNVDNVTFINPVTNQPYHQATIPLGPIDTTTQVRVLEAYASANYWNHEISFGRQDNWLGPGLGGGMAYSNNAENIWSFRINRAEPLRIPGLSRLTGPFRYDFIVGPLRGHTFPADPWVHAEKISFRPTENLEFGFERTVIWGGKGHVPITIHSFLKSFFSFQNVTAAEKFGRNDPGARFGAFDFSYRLPFLRNWLTLYTDGEVHDDVSPIDAPRRASWRPGLYLSHVPGVPRLDVRAEAVTTDPPITNSSGGRFMYWEVVQAQGYTNNGSLFGDWIGREGKGGQGWITYHLSGNEWIQVGVRNQKAAKDFIPGSTSQTIPGTPFLIQGGTTINDINFQAVKRIGKDFEINGNFAYEQWKAPIYLPGKQTVTTTTIQLTWFPSRKVSF
jgi:hypothetical protein